MADARPLLRIGDGIKAQSVGLCRGGRASGGGQGTHGGACVGQRCSCRGTCSASRRRLVVRWHLNTRGRSGSRSRGTLTTCSAVFRARCVGVSPVGCAYSVPCPACCVIRVRELCFRNSARCLSRFCHCTVGPAVCCGRAWRRRREKVVPQRIHEGGRIHSPICACLDRGGGRIHSLSGVIGVTSVREDESIPSEGGRIHSLIRL